MIAGIDYGSKLAGTTVIAILLEDQTIELIQSKKKQDADAFVLEQCQKYPIKQVFLDAPLSLPGVYTDSNTYDDYFYRKGDKLLKAMSPMFLGGLTARAMKLKAQLISQQIEVIEIYPAQLARLLDLTNLNYKKEKEAIPAVLEKIVEAFSFHSTFPNCQNWHQVDALLALHSGWRYLNRQHEVYGDMAEGAIVV